MFILKIIHFLLRLFNYCSPIQLQQYIQRGQNFLNQVYSEQNLQSSFRSRKMLQPTIICIQKNMTQLEFLLHLSYKIQCNILTNYVFICMYPGSSFCVYFSDIASIFFLNLRETIILKLDRELNTVEKTSTWGPQNIYMIHILKLQTYNIYEITIVLHLKNYKMYTFTYIQQVLVINCIFRNSTVDSMYKQTRESKQLLGSCLDSLVVKNVFSKSEYNSTINKQTKRTFFIIQICNFQLNI
eukprot:TRINITY_DN22311_c0_g1_i2.p1 TRINITY_DN22311_c0_g1~~TRINITY_DN22311_c0_g1_i2.p1  ORF type:complete len:241 (-),score=-28.93 TRINITY_DN22311_c0_g1_i2:385-1107(-)